MTFKFPAATKLMLSLAAVGVLAIGLGATQADAQTTAKTHRCQQPCQQHVKQRRVWSGRSEPSRINRDRARGFS